MGMAGKLASYSSPPGLNETEPGGKEIFGLKAQSELLGQKFVPLSLDFSRSLLGLSRLESPDL